MKKIAYSNWEAKHKFFPKTLEVKTSLSTYNRDYKAKPSDDDDDADSDDDDDSAEEKALLKKVKKAAKEQMKSLEETMISVKSFKGFEDRFNAVEEKSKKAFELKSAKEYTDLVEEISKIALDVKSFKETAAGRDRGIAKGSVAELMAKSKAKIDSFISNKSGSLELEYKTGGATETSTDISNRDAYFTWHEGGQVGRIPVRRPFMRELVKNVSTSTEYIKYIDQATIVRDAQNVALCGAITTNTKVTFAVNTVQIQKVKDMVNVCLDMMNDYTFIQGEIQSLLNSSLALAIDNGMVNGNNSAPQLNGIAAVASTFAANGGTTGGPADYTASVPNAQLIDLISVGGAQIRAFGQENMFFPDVVLMNPKDLQSMKYLKNGFQDYIKNNQLFTSLFQERSGRYYIDGMLIVENPLITQNTMFIFDSQKATLYSKPGIGIEFAYENGTNFETDTVTLKVYERLNQLIRNVDANAFLYFPDIAAAIAAINNPGVK